MSNNLNDIALSLVADGKGILAADESKATIEKRFSLVGIPSSLEYRRAYRELLFTTPEIEKYLSGTILYNETIKQSTDKGEAFPVLLARRGIIPGIKVDLGTEPLPGSTEKVTKGMEGLADRLNEYVELGAKFTKWRAVFEISEKFPTDYSIAMNADRLADYAKIAQDAGLVPIVEPEVLMDGDHTIDQCEAVTKKVLLHVFEDLRIHNVDLSGILLKPNMVLSGKDSADQASVSEVAQRTVDLLKEVVPNEVPGIVFLSGGQGQTLACERLQAMSEIKNLPWPLSFSFSRAIQDDVIKAWAGQPENVATAQEILIHRCKLAAAARAGNYSPTMEK